MCERILRVERISFGMGIIGIVVIDEIEYAILKPDLRPARNGESVLSPTVAGGVSAPWEVIEKAEKLIAESTRSATCETKRRRNEGDFRFSISETDIEIIKQIFPHILTLAQSYFATTLIKEAEEELDPNHNDQELLELLILSRMMYCHSLILRNNELFTCFQNALTDNFIDEKPTIVSTTRMRSGNVAGLKKTSTYSQQAFYFPKIDSEIITKLIEVGLCSVCNTNENQPTPLVLVPVALFSDGDFGEESNEESYSICGMNIATSTVKAMRGYKQASVITTFNY